MFEAFCKEKLAPLMLRLALGLVCVHQGFTKIMATGGLSWNPALPAGWQLVIAWGEFGAGVAILLGFWCRLAAALMVALIVGPWAHWQGWHLFHLPWHSLEPIALMVLAGLSLMFLGAGEVSLDRRGAGTASSSSKSGGRRKAAA
jgi:uncharacterized membrane protein YphA (DoxX/SURF4 family)